MAFTMRPVAAIDSRTVACGGDGAPLLWVGSQAAAAQPQQEGAEGAREASIAILPFADLSTDHAVAGNVDEMFERLEVA
jgi:hypothetical protein